MYGVATAPPIVSGFSTEEQARTFMNLRWIKLAAAAAVAYLAFSASAARADFQLIIRATEYNSSGVAEASQSANTSSATSPFQLTAVFQNATALPDFTITVVTNTVNSGSGSTHHGITINVTYNGPTGSSSDSLLIEVLGSNYNDPVKPDFSQISSNASPSTSGLAANSLVMTSGVINTNPTSLNTVTNGTTTLTNTPLDSQSGETTGSGSIGSASSVLLPNPVTGSVFNINNPFAFYQTYTFSGFTNTAQNATLSGGSTVAPVPEPATCLLLLTGLPVLGGYGWLRRRKAVKPA
jgi:hypothetical protein